MKAQNIAIVLGISAFLTVPLAAPAQQSDESLAQKADKVREQEKTRPKAKEVWTNANLPTSGALSIVGKAPQQTNEAGSSNAEAQPAAPSQSAPAQPQPSADELAAKLAELKQQLAAAKAELQSAQTDLNIAQREYKLDSDQYYATPDYASDHAGAAKLAADQSAIAAKQSALDAAQKKVDGLQKKIDEVNAKLKASPPDTPSNTPPQS